MSREDACWQNWWWWDTTDQCESGFLMTCTKPWILYILQPPRQLWHQVPHRSSHQSVWSPDQILAQPAYWHLQQISHLPSHSNELTSVGMQSMVLTVIITDETLMKLEVFLTRNVQRILHISIYQVPSTLMARQPSWLTPVRLIATIRSPREKPANRRPVWSPYPRSRFSLNIWFQKELDTALERARRVVY
jgi:hypothetical protein